MLIKKQLTHFQGMVQIESTYNFNLWQIACIRVLAAMIITTLSVSKTFLTS